MVVKIRPNEDCELKIVTCNIPKKHLKYIETLCRWGITPSRSEYVRRAISKQIEDDLRTKRYIDEVIETIDEDTILIPDYNNGKPIKILRRLEY